MKPLDKEALVDLALELDYYGGGPWTIEETDETRSQYQKKDIKQLYADVIQFLKEINDLGDDDPYEEENEEGVIKALKDTFPDGYIIHQNSDFHQWGGVPEEDEDENED